MEASIYLHVNYNRLNTNFQKWIHFTNTQILKIENMDAVSL